MHVCGFFLVAPVTATNKTDDSDKFEILFNIQLNTYKNILDTL
jgi:hypothetical protein